MRVAFAFAYDTTNTQSVKAIQSAKNGVLDSKLKELHH